ncbi:unnamed protein product [Ilex paraguariensis]|uniref:F-box associated beta-propeller type 3 domain-containing protein n=1 Tax=Ilex paraguariensis TaxID=185542 RepID=A0ABC8QSM3_9AQUA
MVVEAYVNTLGQGYWRCIKDVPYVIHTTNVKSEAFVNGAFHWAIDFPGCPIVSFDISDEVFRAVPCAQLGVLEMTDSLLVLGGCLAAVKTSFPLQIEIWVMKVYGFQESWTKNLIVNLYELGRNVVGVKVLSYLKDDELLLVVNNHSLLSYNPQTTRLRKLNIVGLPSWFEAIAYVGSLVSPSA